MQILYDRIRKDGIVRAGNVLKVDRFLNHQMDIHLFQEIGKEFKRRFEGEEINKILTIEASGIGIACIVAEYFDVPVVFAKKSQSINLDGESYITKVESFTHKRTYDVIVSKKYLNPEDHILPEKCIQRRLNRLPMALYMILLCPRSSLEKAIRFWLSMIFWQRARH